MGLGSFLLSGCGWSSGEKTQEEAKQDQPTPSALETGQAKRSQGMPRGEAPKGASTDVVIDNFTVDPPKLTVSAGTKVTWVNQRSRPAIE
jgi:plastocyanin